MHNFPSHVLEFCGKLWLISTKLDRKVKLLHFSLNLSQGKMLFLSVIMKLRKQNFHFRQWTLFSTILLIPREHAHVQSVIQKSSVKKRAPDDEAPGSIPTVTRPFLNVFSVFIYFFYLKKLVFS